MSTMPVLFDKYGYLPTVPTDLPSEDGQNMETPWHRAQMELLINCTEHRWRERKDFFCGGNMFVHFSAERARNRDFRGPDFFVVLGVEHDRVRPYWAIWDEGGRYPDVIVELLSASTAETDRGEKLAVYERTFRTAEYFLYDPDTRTLEGHRLNRRRYRPIEADANGRLESRELGCAMGPWDGSFDGLTATWLRFYERTGVLVPTGQEYAADKALAERLRADASDVRADAEAAKARKAGVRAKRAVARARQADARAEAAEAELARLRAELAALKASSPPSPPSNP